MRLFVALELPPEVAGALWSWARPITADSTLRAVPREQYHVTLAFLGERPGEEPPAIGEALAARAAPVEGLEVARAAWLPSPRRPSVLAVDLADPSQACRGLQAAVSEALVALGVFGPERRSFRPHVTVGRVRRGSAPPRDVPPPPDLGAFPAVALTLLRSRPTPAGSVYDALARTDLGG